MLKEMHKAMQRRHVEATLCSQKLPLLDRQRHWLEAILHGRSDCSITAASFVRAVVEGLASFKSL